MITSIYIVYVIGTLIGIIVGIYALKTQKTPVSGNDIRLVVVLPLFWPFIVVLVGVGMLLEFAEIAFKDWLNR